MDKDIKSLIGSSSRDTFKWLHKQVLPEKCYAIDIDFVLIHNKGILAIVDYKGLKDEITWSERLVFNMLLDYGFFIYIVRGKLRKQEDYNSKDEMLKDYKQLKVYRYLHSDTISYPLSSVRLELVSDNFVAWEIRLRGWGEYYRELCPEEQMSF